MARPVWEPPALEILDAFETKNWERKDEEYVKILPDIGIRTQFLDSTSQYMVLGRYFNWVKETGKAAIACGDEEREAFYEGLLKELKIKFDTVTEEVLTLLREHAVRELLFMGFGGD